VPRAADRFSGVHYSDVSNIALHLSRMANALHRPRIRLWKTGNQSILTAAIGTRWMSNSKSQNSLSDIEVPSIFSPRIVLMSVPEHSMEG
jgi:hypothetical protein